MTIQYVTVAKSNALSGVESMIQFEKDQESLNKIRVCTQGIRLKVQQRMNSGSKFKHHQQLRSPIV